MTDTEFITTTFAGSVATISLCRPERHNAFNDEMVSQFTAALSALHRNSDVRAVVLRGEGKSFSSGRDTAVLGTRARGESDIEFVARAQDNIRLISSMPVPVIAALKGWVLGGSFEKALHCDVRIAGDDAKMGLPEVGHGLIPDTGGVSRLRALAGPGLTKDLVLTGRQLTAAEALAAGVVSRVVPTAELDAAAADIAARIADQPPLAVRLARQVINDLDNDDHERALRQEVLAQAACFASEDRRELKASKAEGRAPVFRGR
ncbi:enoyl-CoA hydratase/isomerase family protein [[Mycobacterium] vasticus]|uniref:Enoyl-CoA hydratase/isomerase family protein n=1 Tax=[Mycobacterium] vasticus TaxID=2875777 RepID=A0ABU5Z0W7_9MYCO|nr:enoyl-CoA hydratase/isomerase family protein [Mycolicibacter sp. MYC017]MEB3070726.1 enoyl-CoA hydratase/isomerase family protein [Mycolicibacter sp. MYC017]